MRMLRRFHNALSSRSVIIYLILILISVLLAVTLVPELMRTGQSFYEYNDPTYTPKDMERYIYELNSRIAKIAKDYPVSEINKHEFDDIYRRIYGLRKALKAVEMKEELRKLQQRLDELENTFKVSESPGF